MSSYTIEVVPFSQFDWTFEKPGWINLNPTAVGLIAAFCGVAFWTSIELLVLVYVTFRRRTGLYFWSIIITTIGIILQTMGYLLKIFENACPVVFVTIICKVGWVSNVTGFSVVLWSRLHLVVRDPRILRVILIMIIANAVVLHSPIVVFEFGLMSEHRDKFIYPMEVMERIQQTIFTSQETVISGLYIYHTARFLSVGFTSRTRKVVALLIAVQIIAISFDAALTAFDFMNMFTLKCTLHPFVYSVKLKLEFVVLNQLLSIVKRGLTPGLRHGNLPDLNPPEIDGIKGSGSSGTDSLGLPGNTAGPKELPSSQLLDGMKPVGSQFITRAPVVALESSSSSSSNDAPWPPSPSAITVTHEVSVRSLDKDNEVDDEQNLQDVAGKPDEHDSNAAIDDIERQYLGAFGS
ncbi:hypothetical protein B0H67DRAFT_650389 [Lasiosphaeris hirsuta]|uniref:DUF7703 domain-containing protein n=1 Tax=Lasiosphaeris hirsuta TaxID=260670 RepID=A0AA39ZRK5_9PEZI|nr:hypothetical protein B0H67DRAFT_650389 [Lasiosphaeris hirsuta]